LFLLNLIESKANAEIRVARLRQSIKNEIDARVEIVKNELDRQRDEMFNEVDDICNDALKFV
jgi:hypothetical protein